MTTLKQFADNMRAAASKTGSDGAHSVASNEKAKRVAAAFLRYVVDHTPVDTSLAVSNWQVSIGNMPSLLTTDIVAARYYGSKGSTAAASRSATIADGLAEIAKKQPGQRLYVYNMLPYIRTLDEGHSQQEAAGFVGRARLYASKVA